jgi:renalase
VGLKIAVIGAGLAGLMCAKHLQERGFEVIVVDKSRGVGGRMATRRLHETRVDFGLPFWEVQGALSAALTREGLANQRLHPWGDRIEQWGRDRRWQTFPLTQRYVSAEGINAIAKDLAANLTVQRQFRALKLSVDSTQHIWRIESETEFIEAPAVVLAIPAPQAAALLTTSALDCPPQLHSVTFHPCITVMAGYDRDFAAVDWQAVKLEGDHDLAWIIRDSSKYPQPPQPTFIFPSTPSFAQNHLDTADLQPIGAQLLTQASQHLHLEFNAPEWMQIHRWRYARTKQALNQPYLLAPTPLPLICCGDWCLGDSIEAALESAIATARAFSTILSDS